MRDTLPFALPRAKTPNEPLHAKDTQRLGIPGYPPLTEEVLPVSDGVVIADQHTCRHHARCDRLLAQAQAGLVRKAVGLARVHFAVGEDAVVPRCLAAARAGHD